MKTLSKIGLMLALAGSLFLSSCAGSYYVSDQPVEPVYDRPVAPYEGAIWMTANGAGAAAGTFMHAATGITEGQAILTFVVPGCTPTVATHGIEGIGINPPAP